MRQVRFSKLLPAEDEAQLLAFWASLCSSSPQLDEPATHQHLINEQGRFVISLARQYQMPALGAEALLAAAHSALVAFLTHSGNQPKVIRRHFAHVLRDAMILLL
jgi:hypothetical protein